MDVAELVVTNAVGEDTLCDLKEIQRWCAACVVSRSKMVARKPSLSDGTVSAHGASSNLNSVVDNQWRIAQDSSVNTGGFMEQVSSEMMKMLERMAAQMLRDGVTPEMFQQDMAAFTEAFMADDLKKTERMTLAYFHNQQFRHDVIMATAEMAQ